MYSELLSVFFNHGLPLPCLACAGRGRATRVMPVPMRVHRGEEASCRRGQKKVFNDAKSENKQTNKQTNTKSQLYASQFAFFDGWVRGTDPPNPNDEAIKKVNLRICERKKKDGFIFFEIVDDLTPQCN
jgi:hypothetical protein